MTTRRAAVAGMFYPQNKDSLLHLIEESFRSPVGPQQLPSATKEKDEQTPFYVAPHAGYIYSGPIAAWTYFDLSKYTKPDTVVILGPNHYGIGPDIATVERVDEWETPLGKVRINKDLIEELTELDSDLRKDDRAHEKEHSIEVQLPFLQYIFNNEFDIVPIAMTYQRHESSIKLGKTLAEICKNRNIVIIASSDFTHQEPYEQAKNKDLKIIQAIEQMDSILMYKIKEDLYVTMCGAGPIAATIQASLDTNRLTAKKLKYASSGDTAGDKYRVVGYGSIKFFSK
ncbi:MAG: AmmeMemoRadiSam system protein B [Candidatus Heimdallarchaeaceae archaeon]